MQGTLLILVLCFVWEIGFWSNNFLKTRVWRPRRGLQISEYLFSVNCVLFKSYSITMEKFYS